MSTESSGKPDAWKLACPVWGWGRGETPRPTPHATQDGSRGVWLCDKASERKVKVEPPAEWGRYWTWNVTEDGTGIYFERTTQ